MLTDTNPAGRYWIKLDGTDVKEALQHSVKDKWAGDVDVNDNKLHNYVKSTSQEYHSLSLVPQQLMSILQRNSYW